MSTDEQQTTPEAPPPPDLATLVATSAQAATSFEELLGAAVAEAKSDAPTAAFYEADGAAPKGATSFGEIPKWRFVFTDMKGGTIEVFAEDGKITSEKYVDEPWLEDRVISLPVRITLMAAISILQGSGIPFDKFYYVNLRWPLVPGVTEPQYIFQTAISTFVSVGANSGHIQVLTNVGAVAHDARILRKAPDAPTELYPAPVVENT